MDYSFFGNLVQLINSIMFLLLRYRKYHMYIFPPLFQFTTCLITALFWFDFSAVKFFDSRFNFCNTWLNTNQCNHFRVVRVKWSLPLASRTLDSTFTNSIINLSVPIMLHKFHLVELYHDHLYLLFLRHLSHVFYLSHVCLIP